MKAITVNSQIKQFKKIPKVWNRLATPDQVTNGYDTLSDEEHYADGWRDLVEPTYDELTQKKMSIYFDEDNDYYSWNIEEMTQEEQDAYIEIKEDNDEAAEKVSKYKRDGIIGFDRAIALIVRKMDSGNITPTQAKNFTQGIYPVIEPLYKGLWQLVKVNLNDATPPTNQKLLDIFNIIKNKVDNYVTQNY